MIAGEQHNVILQLRLDGLHKNLEQIRAIEQSVKRRRSEILRLRRCLEEDPTAELLGAGTDEATPAPTLLGDLTTLRFALGELTTVRDHLKQGGAVTPAVGSRLDAGVDGAREAFESMRGLLTEVNRIVLDLYLRWSEVQEDWLTETFRGLAAAPMRELGEIKRAAGLLEEEVDAAAEAAGAPEGEGEDPPDLAAVWRRYDELYSEQLSDLFAGYVEVLGGLALRNVGADQGVCRMSDALVDQWVIAGSQLGHSLTIPARRETTRRTLKRIIRLGFPEWTVWAVPLAAHELASVVLEEDTPMVDDARALELPLDDDALRTLLTDAFATAIMGPAYACSMVMLHLDPVAREDGAREDFLRAEVVFAMLEHLDADERGMAAVREKLETAWRLALDQAAAPAGPPAGAPPDRKALLRVARIVADFLTARSTGLIYDSGRWARAAGFDSSNGGASRGARRRDTRDILSWAWWRRMSGENADTVAAKAYEEWLATQTSGPAPASGQGGTGPVW